MISRTKVIRQSRITSLHNAAKTGKYTWKDLRTMAEKMGASNPTVKSYLDEVKERLQREGLIQ